MQALLLDVKNYDAFRELVEGSMMTSAEGAYQCFQLQVVRADRAEWEFMENLAYRSQLSDEQANFVKLMYRTKLKKVSRSGPRRAGTRADEYRTSMSARSLWRAKSW